MMSESHFIIGSRPNGVSAAKALLARAQLGLRLGQAETVSIPLFSPFTRTDMMLVEVLQ